eukprot:2486740-Lingulodinium_polyedra.AAC.1
MAAAVQACAKTGSGLSRDEAHLCAQLCEASKEVCRMSTKRLVGKAADRPLLQSCSADGTPMQVSTRVRQALPGGRVHQRAGKAGYEFLVASQFTRLIEGPGQSTTSV